MKHLQFIIIDAVASLVHTHHPEGCLRPGATPPGTRLPSLGLLLGPAQERKKTESAPTKVQVCFLALSSHSTRFHGAKANNHCPLPRCHLPGTRSAACGAQSLLAELATAEWFVLAVAAPRLHHANNFAPCMWALLDAQPSPATSPHLAGLRRPESPTTMPKLPLLLSPQRCPAS